MKKKLFMTAMMTALALALCLGMCSCGEGEQPYDGLDLDEYLTVGQYKGLEVDGYKIKVSEKDIQDKIEENLNAKKTDKELKKGDELKSGDTANIDYTGKINGKEFEGGTAEGYDLQLGSNTFIPGFEDGLIGKKVGETVDLNLTFPKDYSQESLAGKDVVFTVKINSAKRSEVPEYTVEFVKENTKYDTKEAYEEALRKEIYKEKEATAQQEQKTSLWSDVLADTKVKKYPEEEMAAYEQVFNDQIDKLAEQYGMSRKEVLKQMYGTDDEAQVKSIIEDSTKTLIKQEMLTEYIAKKEKLKYTKEEKEKTIAEIEAQGYDEETVKTYTGRTMDQYAHIRLLYDKVQDFILDNAKIKKAK